MALQQLIDIPQLLYDPRPSPGSHKPRECLPLTIFSGRLQRLAGVRRGCIEGRGKLNYVFNRMTGREDGLIRTYGLENVAGAGKIAITHSLSRRCYDEGILSSSSSFDRENPARSQLL